MAKPIPNRPRKKHGSKFQREAHVQESLWSEKPKPVAKAKRKKLQPPKLRSRGWMVAGFDTSMSSVAGAAIGYDATLRKFVGPEFVIRRWTKEDHYFDRLKDCAKAHEILLDLQHELGLELSTSEVWIAQEEPWPVGMPGKGMSGFLKQQAEISGAFLGGLIRYGYNNVEQMNSIKWRTMIANDLQITTHHSKWRSPELASIYNCKPVDTGKFRTKQWAFHELGIGPVLALMDFTRRGDEKDIPDWPDIIESSHGKIPRPEKSVAKAVQPDDRYDALAVMWTHFQELVTEGTLKHFRPDDENPHGYWEVGDY